METDENCQNLAKNGENEANVTASGRGRVARRQEAGKRAFLLALGESGGHIGKALAAARLDNVTVWRWRNVDPDFDAECERVRVTGTEHVIRQVEDVITDVALQGDPKMCRLFMQVKGRIIEKREHSGEIGFRPGLLTGATD